MIQQLHGSYHPNIPGIEQPLLTRNAFIMSVFELAWPFHLDKPALLTTSSWISTPSWTRKTRQMPHRWRQTLRPLKAFASPSPLFCDPSPFQLHCLLCLESCTSRQDSAHDPH